MQAKWPKDVLYSTFIYDFPTQSVLENSIEML
jgi:hypothetical protein